MSPLSTALHLVTRCRVTHFSTMWDPVTRCPLTPLDHMGPCDTIPCHTLSTARNRVTQFSVTPVDRETLWHDSVSHLLTAWDRVSQCRVTPCRPMGPCDMAPCHTFDSMGQCDTMSQSCNLSFVDSNLSKELFLCYRLI